MVECIREKVIVEDKILTRYASTDTLSVLDALLEETVDTTDRELETSFCGVTR